MNCEHVFSILTRGPFPTGEETDQFVELHLQQCAGCRELAEALRPIPEFGPESVTDEESWELPVYWSQNSDSSPSASSSGVAATAQAAMRRMVRRASPHRPVVDRVGLRLAGAVLLGVVFGFGWQVLNRQMHETPGEMRASASIEKRFERQAKRQTVEVELLQQIGMAAACYKQLPPTGWRQETLAESPLRDVRYAEIKCCTQCHHRQASFFTTQQTTTAITKRCSACHQED